MVRAPQDRLNERRLLGSPRPPPRRRPAIPWLYLKGISSGEMDAALKVLLGVDAKGLSASTVSRLKQLWAEEYRNWRNGALDKDRWVYIWVDGIYSGLRGEQAKLCALVVIGANELGDKHFVAIEDGMWESTQSWQLSTFIVLCIQQRCWRVSG